MTTERYDGAAPVNLVVSEEITIRELTDHTHPKQFLCPTRVERPPWLTVRLRFVPSDVAMEPCQLHKSQPVTSSDEGLRNTIDWYESARTRRTAGADPA